MSCRFSRWSMLCLVILGIVFFTPGCDALIDSALSDAAPTTYKEDAEGEDVYAAELLAGKNDEGEIAVPAAEFFANPQKYAVWKGDREEFKTLCDNCLAAGAPAAHAVVLDEEVKVCSTYIITMPTAPAARAKVIAAYNQFWRTAFDADKIGATPSEDEKEMLEELKEYLAQDVGQKYLTLYYDP